MIFKAMQRLSASSPTSSRTHQNGPFHQHAAHLGFLHEENGQWIQNGSDTALHPESTEEPIGVAAAFGRIQMKQRLLDAREAVWRAYFAGDRATLEG